MPKLTRKYGPRDAKGRRSFKGYYAEFYDPNRKPRQKVVSLKTKDGSAARAAMARIERDYSAREYDPWTDPTPVGRNGVALTEAIERFLQSRRDDKCSTPTVQTYQYVLGPFARRLPPDALVTHVTTRHVVAFLESGGRKPATVKTHRERLRIFARWCRDHRLAPPTWDPVPERARGKVERSQTSPKYFTVDELARLLRAIEADGQMRPSAARMAAELHDVVVFTVNTGLRRGEVCALRWSDVDVPRNGAAGTVRVSNRGAHSTKSGRERAVPLVGDALAIVRRRLANRTGEGDGFVFPGARGGQLSGGYLGGVFRKYVRLARVRDGDAHNFHSLRHTFGTLAVNRGFDLYRLKEVMGHSDIAMTTRYARIHARALTTDMEKAFGSGLVESHEATPVEHVSA